MESPSPGYQVETTTYHIGAHDYRIRALHDRQQYSDPDGCAERAGISSAAWPMFGVLWPAGLALAEEMSRFSVTGKSILEVGCGLGLPSLVLQQRGADITASDHHPLAEEFLRHNTTLNSLAPIHFFTAPWIELHPGLGRFDLIIGSDLLYERDHASLLAGFLARHANPACQVLLADPGRSNCGRFHAHMLTQGYLRSESPFGSRGRLFSFVRAHG
jgi:predicted nicotinamide N-methyase